MLANVRGILRSVLLPSCLSALISLVSSVDLGPWGVQKTGGSEIGPHPEGKET